MGNASSRGAVAMKIRYARAPPSPKICKGDIMRNYGSIAEKYYGYKISVIDLRNPMRSHGNNLLHLVNKYALQHSVLHEP